MPRRADPFPATRPRRRTHGALAVATLVLAVPLLGGCGDDEADTRSEAAGLPSLEVDLGAREWLLDPGASTPTVEGGEPVTLTLRDDLAAGTGPCNAFSGPFELDGDDLSIGRLATTRRACEPAVMDAEAALLDALAAVTAAEIDDDDRLVLTGDGDVRLVFRSYDADELLEGAWRVVNVGRGETLEGVVAGSEPVLTFGGDGALAVTGGCNTIGSQWHLAGDRLTVELGRETLMECADPPGLMEQDAAIRSALQRAHRVEITPRSLVVLDDRGSIGLYAVRPADGS